MCHLYVWTIQLDALVLFLNANKKNQPQKELICGRPFKFFLRKTEKITKMQFSQILKVRSVFCPTKRFCSGFFYFEPSIPPKLDTTF